MMISPAARARTFIALVIAVLVPSIPVVEKWGGARAVLPYLAVAALVLWGTPAVARFLERQPRRLVIVMALLAFAVVITALFVIYPIANVHIPGRGSDSDDALDLATSRLLSGRYPYGERTYLGNPAIPMPGELILAAPFVLLGGSAYQIVLWLPIAFACIARTGRSFEKAFAALAVPLVASPVLMHGIVTGSDHLPNSIMVLVAFGLAVRGAERGSSGIGRYASLAFLGLTLSTRATFSFLVPVLAATSFRNGGIRRAVEDVAMVGIVALAVTLPFFIADPAHFAPLHTANKTRVVPYGPVVVPALSLGTAIVLAARVDGSLGAALRAGFWALSVPVLIVAAATLATTGQRFAFWYGDLAMLFSISSHGLEWVNAFAQSRANDVGSARKALDPA